MEMSLYQSLRLSKVIFRVNQGDPPDFWGNMESDPGFPTSQDTPASAAKTVCRRGVGNYTVDG